MEWKLNLIRSRVLCNENMYEAELGLNFRADIRMTNQGFAEWRIVFRHHGTETVLFSGVEDSQRDAQRIVLDAWSNYAQSLQNALRPDEERQREIDRLMLMRDV